MWKWLWNLWHISDQSGMLAMLTRLKCLFQNFQAYGQVSISRKLFIETIGQFYITRKFREISRSPDTNKHHTTKYIKKTYNKKTNSTWLSYYLLVLVSSEENIYINIFTLTNVPLQLIGKALLMTEKSVFYYNPTWECSASKKTYTA